MKIPALSPALSFLALLSFFSISSQVFAQAYEDCLIEEVFYGNQRAEKVKVGDKQAAREKPGNLNQTGGFAVRVASLSKTSGGEQVGYSVVRRTNLGLSSVTPGPNSMYEQATTHFLPEGKLVTLGIADYDSELVSQVSERAIVGGTGKYAGAQGVIIREMLNKHELKATIKARVPCLLAK